MGKPKNILQYLSKKLGTSSSELSDFLFIDRRTLYNYKNLADETMPDKVKSKIMEYFKTNYDNNIGSMSELYDFIDQLNEQEKNQLYRHFVLALNTRYKITEHENDEICKMVDSLNVSKTFKKSLFELLEKKLQSGNDYGLLEYIDNYKK